MHFEYHVIQYWTFSSSHHKPILLAFTYFLLIKFKDITLLHKMLFYEIIFRMVRQRFITRSKHIDYLNKL